MVQEIDRRASDFTLLPRQVASAIAQMHGIELDVFVMIRKGTSLKTSSGKIRRAATRRAFLEGTLEVVGVWRHVAASAAATSPVSTTVAVSPFEIEIWLRTRIARMVGLQPHEILPEENYATYGLDSLASTLIVADLEQWLGRTIPETITWDYPSIRLLAEYLGREATCRAN